MTRSLALAAAIVFGASGCGSDDEESGLGAPPTFPVPGCEDIDHRPCDVLKERCQARLMRLAACLRGSEPLDVPPVTLMTAEEYVAYLNENIAENPPPDPNHYETALDLLDLVLKGALAPAAVVARDVEFVAGFYRREEKDVVIVDRGVPVNEPEPNSVLVHEFVHAMQDADVDLARYYDEYSTSYDSYLGVASVVEGEARLHQTRFWASLLGLDPAAIDWDEHFQNVAEFAEEEVLATPSPYVTTFSYFQYELGARLVHHAWSESGRDGVDQLFASPPTRAHTVMASVESIATDTWPAPEFLAPEIPAPFTPWTEASLGAWGLYLRLARRTDLSRARSLALSWRGDHLGVYVGDGEAPEVVAVWRIELSNEAFATQIEALEISGVRREGSRIVIARSTGTVTPEWALTP